MKSLKVNKIINIKTNKITLILIKLKFRNKTKVKTKDKTLEEILFWIEFKVPTFKLSSHPFNRMRLETATIYHQILTAFSTWQNQSKITHQWEFKEIQWLTNRISQILLTTIKTNIIIKKDKTIEILLLIMNSVSYTHLTLPTKRIV